MFSIYFPCSTTITTSPTKLEKKLTTEHTPQVSSNPNPPRMEVEPISNAFTNSKRQPKQYDNSKVTRGITQFLANTGLPFTFVTNNAFVKLMCIVSPDYTIPDSSHFANQHLPHMCIGIQESVKLLLHNIKCMNLAIDTFVGYNGNRFIGVAASFINDEWELVKVTLGCREFNENSTTEQVASKVTDILHYFSIETSRVCSVTTEQGSIVESAVSDILGWPHLPCFSQILMKFVEYVKMQPFVDEIVCKIRALHHLLSTNSQSEYEFNAIQSAKGLPTTKMPQSCPEKWWHESPQFDFVKTNGQEILQFCNPVTKSEIEKIDFNENDLRKVSIVHSLMKDLNFIYSTLIEDTSATASLIHPVVAKGELIVAKVGVHFPMIPGLSQFRAYIKTRYAELKAELQTINCNHLDIATFLDPRFARSNIDIITTLLLQDPIAQEEEPNMEPTTERSCLQLFLGDDDDQDDAVPINNFERDVTAFLLEDKISLDASPLSWWKRREASLKFLSRIAKQYMCTATNCLPQEQPITGTLGLGLNKGPSLSDDQVEHLIFLLRNQKLIV